MPKAFEHCMQGGGRVRTSWVKKSAGKQGLVCYPKGGSHGKSKGKKAKPVFYARPIKKSK